MSKNQQVRAIRIAWTLTSVSLGFYLVAIALTIITIPLSIRDCPMFLLALPFIFFGFVFSIANFIYSLVKRVLLDPLGEIYWYLDVGLIPVPLFIFLGVFIYEEFFRR